MSTTIPSTLLNVHFKNLYTQLQLPNLDHDDCESSKNLRSDFENPTFWCDYLRAHHDISKITTSGRPMTWPELTDLFFENYLPTHDRDGYLQKRDEGFTKREKCKYLHTFARFMNTSKLIKRIYVDEDAENITTSTLLFGNATLQDYLTDEDADEYGYYKISFECNTFKVCYNAATNVYNVKSLDGHKKLKNFPPLKGHMKFTDVIIQNKSLYDLITSWTIIDLH